tara:strand:- start:79 stop:312 length:234 start_codon:yes stop_codon:yes gene_type:complete
MIEINVLDFVLSMSLSYLIGVGTGLTICCKYKDKFMSSSMRNTSSVDNIHQMEQVVHASAPPMPPPSVNPSIKVTLE